MVSQNSNGVQLHKAIFGCEIPCLDGDLRRFNLQILVLPFRFVAKFNVAIRYQSNLQVKSHVWLCNL